MARKFGRGRADRLWAWLTQLFRQLARQLVKVLRGTKPSDVPVEQRTTLELAIILKTANAPGITFPLSLLGRADEVVQ